MNGRDFTIKVNAFEGGVLIGVIYQLDNKKQQALKSVAKQLIALKEECEQESEVRKEVLPGGFLKITDRDGNTIIRPPYPWETEDN